MPTEQGAKSRKEKIGESKGQRNEFFSLSCSKIHYLSYDHTLAVYASHSPSSNNTINDVQSLVRTHHLITINSLKEHGEALAYSCHPRNQK